MPLHDNPYYGREDEVGAAKASAWAEGYSACRDDARAANAVPKGGSRVRELAIPALHEAVVMHPPSPTADVIVARAKKFYAFLIGEEDAQSSTE